MAVQYKFFVIPVKNTERAEEELNRFLKATQPVNITREFVAQGENSFLFITIEHLVSGAPSKTSFDQRSRIDYKEVLNADDFELFAKLRNWRKEVAAKENIQLYNVFTNEQLAKIAEKRITTAEGLKKLSGVGEARINKYAAAVFQIVHEINKTQKRPAQK